jgi:dolichol-phosphate mannosyltransferase
MKDRFQLQILLPVHNEADNLAQTVDEIHREITSKIENSQILITEDGSTDNTIEVLKQLKEKYPLSYISGKERKKYAKAVFDGLKTSSSEFILFLDGDGQCDPKDFWNFWNLRNDNDLIVGYRNPRKDDFHRILISRAFYFLYRLKIKTKLKDPSCPYLLFTSDVRDHVVSNSFSMIDGFWWEFNALISRSKFKITQLPINHRVREFGVAKTLILSKLPKVGWHHLVKLIKL